MQYARIDGLDRPASRLVQGCMMPGSDRAKEFQDRLAAAGVRLSDGERAWLDMRADAP